jgi:hypothetical protein
MEKWEAFFFVTQKEIVPTPMSKHLYIQFYIRAKNIVIQKRKINSNDFSPSYSHELKMAKVNNITSKFLVILQNLHAPGTLFQVNGSPKCKLAVQSSAKCWHLITSVLCMWPWEGMVD